MFRLQLLRLTGTAPSRAARQSDLNEMCICIYIYTSVRDESTFEALLLRRSRSATPATFHSRGINTMAECRFIVKRLLDGLHPRSTSVFFRY